MKSLVLLVAVLLSAVAHAQGTSLYICEGHNSVLSCPPNLKIQIDFAYYGRLQGRSCTAGPILSKECRAEGSEKIVKHLCENKSSCTLKANNKIYGDPCVGTYKFLHVKYCCS